MELNPVACRARFASGELPKADYIRLMHASYRRLFEIAALMTGSTVARIEILPGEVQIVLADGARFWVDPEDVRQPQLEELHFGGFEAHEWDSLCALVRPGMRVLDVGANIGWYTVRFARRFPDVTIDAFEPVPHTFGVLARNVGLNAPKNVTLHPFGLSDREGEADFHFSAASTGAASAANILGLPDAATVRVRLRTLDGFCRDTGTAPDFIKCDVEGGELLFLKGGRETVRAARPMIFLEMLRKWAAKFGYHPNEIIDLLAGDGYACFEMTPAGPAPLARMTDATAGTNFLFLHPDRHSDTIREVTRHEGQSQ